MSHIVPSHQVDSQGGDCTDPDTHSVRVLVTGGGGSGGGGGGGGALTEQTFSHAYTAPGDDTFTIDVSTFNTLSVAWGAGTTNHDGDIIVYLSNDGGLTWGPWFFSTTAADDARAQIPVFKYYRVMPAFLNVAGIDRVQFRSSGFTFGTGVIFVRASTGQMWLPTQGAYLMDGRGGSIAFVDDGRLEVNVMNTVEQRKITWGAALAPTTATVTAASSQIVAGSARNGLVLSNLSPTEPIFIGFSTPAVLNSGIAIMPRERFDLSDRETGHAINAIVATGPVTVAIQEFS